MAIFKMIKKTLWMWYQKMHMGKGWETLIILQVMPSISDSIMLGLTSYLYSVSRDIAISNSGHASSSPVDGYEVVMKCCGAWRDIVLHSPAFFIATAIL